MGGKSRKVSNAIEWYFDQRGEEPSYDDLLRNIAVLQTVITEQGTQLEKFRQSGKNGQISPNKGSNISESEPQSRGILVKIKNLFRR